MSLRGTLAAGAHYLVRMSSVGSARRRSARRPTASPSPSISMATAGGQVLLLDNAGPLTARRRPGRGRRRDRHGRTRPERLRRHELRDRAGSGRDRDARAPTGRRPAPTPTTTPPTSRWRAPTPEACTCVPADAGSFSGSIAEIQGTDTDTTPHLDKTVTTTGVVTASTPPAASTASTCRPPAPAATDATTAPRTASSSSRRPSTTPRSPSATGRGRRHGERVRRADPDHGHDGHQDHTGHGQRLVRGVPDDRGGARGPRG